MIVIYSYSFSPSTNPRFAPRLSPTRPYYTRISLIPIKTRQRRTILRILIIIQQAQLLRTIVTGALAIVGDVPEAEVVSGCGH